MREIRRFDDDPTTVDQTEIVRGHDLDAEESFARAVRHEKAGLQGERQGLRMGLIGGGVVLSLGIVLFVVFRAPSKPINTSPCMREHAGFIDIKPSCTEPVTIEREGDVMLAHPGASLEERNNGMRVREGKVSFIATPRADGNALRVLVSHGVLEITGTRFTVEQHGEGGHVKVEEGTVIFHDDGGGDVTLAAGTEVAWPREHAGDVVTLSAVPLAAPTKTTTATVSSAPRPTPIAAAPSAPAPAAPPAPSPPPTPAPPTTPVVTAPSPFAGVATKAPPAKAPEPVPVEEEDEDEDEVPAGPMTMEDLLKRISFLRAQKRTREAVELLVAQSRRGDVTDAQMARLSWEIGLFLQDSGDKAATCNHWKNHARKYPDDAAHSERVHDFIKACDAPQ